jgi:hypothetical protein
VAEATEAQGCCAPVEIDVPAGSGFRTPEAAREFRCSREADCHSLGGFKPSPLGDGFSERAAR